MTALRTLTRQDARRLAISRQYLDRQPKPDLLPLIRDLGCVQLDPIRHVERTHRLVLWSRLGNYSERKLNQLRFRDRSLFEFWAHAASLVLTEEYPVHDYQMAYLRDPERSRWARGMRNWFEEKADELVPLKETIIRTLEENGPMLSREIEGAREQGSRWYNGRYVPRILDYLWSRGEAMIFNREGNQRVWGLAQDFWPPETPQESWPVDAVTAFAAQKSIRALGVATPVQLKKHYTRRMYPNLNEVLAGLVAEGVVEPVRIVEKKDVLPGTWYLHREDVPRLEQIQSGEWRGRTVLLSPFDNLICDRDRTELLWDFYYRIEIYVPKAKREFGYYVLPILHNDKLVGRIDSQMDRKQGVYRIDNVYAEAGAPQNARLVKAIARTVKQLATMLGAERIDWGTVPAAWGKLPNL